MKYKKSVLTQFAKTCAWGAKQMLDGVCIAGEISKSDIGYSINNDTDDELLFEVSKRFAKYAKDQIEFDVDNVEVQDFQNIIAAIVNCCDENDWFGN